VVTGAVIVIDFCSYYCYEVILSLKMTAHCGRGVIL
jgi:hypothetical protein